MSEQSHWDRVYASRQPTETSWYQPHADISLQLIAATGAGREQPIIDIGAGASVLAEELLDAGYSDITALDISSLALQAARRRMGTRSRKVHWLCEDVTAWTPSRQYAVWHDRAAFHFLVNTDDRQAYLEALGQGLAANGHLILGAFALSGPKRCSGLEVLQYDADRLLACLGPAFDLLAEHNDLHVTPWGDKQGFAWFHCIKHGQAS